MKIVLLAKRRMDGLRLGPADEEDVALSAMNSFCRVAKNRSDPIADSTELWKLLATIVKRKVNKERQRQYARKRQEYRWVEESAMSPAQDGREPEKSGGFAQFPVREPSPEELAQHVDTCEALLKLLDEKEKECVILKIEGFSTAEIVEKTGSTTRSVQRRFQKVKKIWERWQTEMEKDEKEGEF